MHPLQTQFISEIEKLASAQDSVLWAMDSRFENELFISSTYKTLWGRSHVDLYQDIQYCNCYLNDNKDNNKFASFRERIINPVHTVVYSLNLPHNKNQWIQDRSFHLNDSKGQCLLIAGAALMINEEDCSGEKQHIVSDKLDFLCVELYRLLKLPLLSSIDVAFDLDAYPLNEKQKQILKFTLLGMTAKEIAKRTDLSFRTVEIYTDKIKEVFNVANKSELIIMAIENNWISLNI